MSKKLLIGLSSLVCFLLFLIFLNMTLFWVWRSAFTHANLERIQYFFYASCAGTLVFLILTVLNLIWFFKIHSLSKLNATPPNTGTGAFVKEPDR